MNFKIENNFIEITNYPLIERHFEDMASKGWLIHKIILGSMFIYKKIEKEELDFSITPYEIETAFTRKSKDELEEFNSVCKSVGWNNATKSFDLHIYFKEKGSEATPIQTDEEEEFKTLEFIGEKRLKSLYIQLPFLLFFSWFLLGGLFNNIHSMKDGFGQIAVIFVPIGLILTIWGIAHMRKFLKKNRKNIELGKSMEYSDSNFYIPKITFPLTLIFFLVIIIYLLYMAIGLKNKILLIGFVPALIGFIGGTSYRFFVKPSKKSLTYKKVGFLVMIISIVLISSWVGIFNIGNIRDSKDKPELEGYKVLSIDDFPHDSLEKDGNLLRQNSFLVPKSYDYNFFTEKSGLILTQYGRALTEDLAKELVRRYKRQGEIALTGRFGREVELYFEEGVFDDYLIKSGITKGDLDKLKNKDIKEAEKVAIEMIQQRSVIEDNENLWDLDEVYFLNYEKTEIVLRNRKEVFFLEGKDFSNPQIIRIVKDKLELN